MTDFKIEIPPDQLSKVRLTLIAYPNAQRRVQVRAINKTITGTIANAAKEISTHYNLTQKRIKQDFTRINATFAKPGGIVRAKGKPVGLITFRNTSQVKDGVWSKIKVNFPRFKLKHAFIATPKKVKQSTRDQGLGKQVFWRASRIRSRRLFKTWGRSPKYAVLPEHYRYDIYRLTGPRIEDEYNKPRTHNAVMKYAGDRIKTVTNQELNYEFSKLK